MVDYEARDRLNEEASPRLVPALKASDQQTYVKTSTEFAATDWRLVDSEDGEAPPSPGLQDRQLCAELQQIIGAKQILGPVEKSPFTSSSFQQPSAGAGQKRQRDEEVDEILSEHMAKSSRLTGEQSQEDSPCGSFVSGWLTSGVQIGGLSKPRTALRRVWWWSLQVTPMTGMTDAELIEGMLLSEDEGLLLSTLLTYSAED
ncbi:hypothetical protein Efla_000741 [Eimeria flavescens]